MVLNEDFCEAKVWVLELQGKKETRTSLKDESHETRLETADIQIQP